MRQRGGLMLIIGVVLGVLLTLIVGAVLIAPLALTHRTASGLEQGYGDFAVSLVARLRRPSATPQPVSARTLQAAREAYTGSCSQCHGALGDGNGAFGHTTFPPATNLTTGDPTELSDGQLFAIIKNGLSFTPMPAYGSQYSDDEIWGLVGFIRTLQHGGAPSLEVTTPTTAQLTAGRIQTAGNAAHGAEVYAAAACGACHGPSGALSIDPTDTRETTSAIRIGRPGMPCYTSSALSDADLNDLLSYIATFPPGGALKPDEGPPPSGTRAPATGTPVAPSGEGQSGRPRFTSVCGAAPGFGPAGASRPSATPAR